MRLKGLFAKKTNQKSRWVHTGAALIILTVMFFNFNSVAGTSEHSAKGNFITPVSGARLTLSFGQMKHPFTKKMFQHNGIDLAAKKGTPIVAAADGVVTKVGYNEKQGHFMALQHKEAYTTVYTHLQKTLSKEGDKVKQNDIIAKMGDSGVATGSHVHFEIRKDNTPVDPLELINLK